MIKAIALATILASTGCGALFNDRHQEVNVTAPQGVTVTLDGMPIGLGHVSLDARHSHVFAAFRDGVQVATCQVSAEINAKYVVGDVLLGFWPIVIDAVTNDWAVFDHVACNF